MGVRAAARLMGVSTTKARYWDQKARDHTFHPDRHGGRRYSTLEWPDELALQWAVFYMWRTEPALTDEQVVDFLRQQGWTWDPSQLKYLDESHFENWDCSRWQYYLPAITDCLRRILEALPRVVAKWKPGRYLTDLLQARPLKTLPAQHAISQSAQVLRAMLPAS
eukprot:g11123.t1